MKSHPVADMRRKINELEHTLRLKDATIKAAILAYRRYTKDPTPISRGIFDKQMADLIFNVEGTYDDAGNGR